MRFSEVNDPLIPHTLTCYIRQGRSKKGLYVVYAEWLYALANDAFGKVDKAVVELQLIGLFIEGLYHDFLCMKVMRDNPKNISGCSTIHIGRTQFLKEISIKVK